MAWGAKITATQLTSITTEQVFDQTPTLNPRESAHCRVAVDFPASPTDDAVISVYGSLDGTAWSATPLMAMVLDKDVDPNSIDFIVTGVYQFRVGVKRSGSTDTLASADLAFRKWRERLTMLSRKPPIWNPQPGLVARPWREHWRNA